MKTVELASRILTQLGFYQEPSRELGVDDRRDNIVHLIEEYITTQTKPLSDEEIVQLKAEIVAHKKTNELLAQKIEQLEKELLK